MAMASNSSNINHNTIPILLLTRILLLILLLCLSPNKAPLLSSNNNNFVFVHASLNEHERVSQYHSRNYTWPPLEEEYVPNTDGWKRIMKRRLEQVRRIEDISDMYNGWVATIHTALIAPNFTEYGWAITRAPQGLLDELVKSAHRGLSSPHDMPPEEGIGSTCIDVPNPSNRPLLHPIEHLERRALLELHPIAEAWINHHNHENQHHDDDYNYDDGNQWTMQRTERKKERVERKHLIGNNAYGLRIYKNGSRLNMHVDKSGTHVVSAILHVDHDANSKPWVREFFTKMCRA